MFTINTKYLPTSGRIKARSSGGVSKIIKYDYALHADENHILACETLLEKLHHGGTWVGGHSPDGYVFVCIEVEGKSKVVWDWDYMILRDMAQI